jgi:hypothetical protein
MTPRAAIHALSAAGLIAIATVATATQGVFEITRPGPTKPAPYLCTYKYNVSGTKAKGSEKYHMSVGTAFPGPTGLSCRGQLEASRHDRPSFQFTLFAPIGQGKGSETKFKYKYDSDPLGPEESQVDRSEVAEALAALDDDLAAAAFPFKKPPQAVNGTFDVERLRVKGKAKISRSQLSGSIKFQVTGTISSGEHDGKPFKALLKTKVRRAPDQGG